MQSLTLMKRRLHGAEEEGRDLEGLDLRGARAFGSSWKDCKFIHPKLDGGDYQSSKFVECSFLGGFARIISMKGCWFVRCHFEGMELSQADFTGSVFRDSTFKDCDLDYSCFADVTLRGKAVFDECNLHGADLSFMETEKPSFLGCNLWGAKVPWGCQVFNGYLDERTIRFGLALLASACGSDLKGKIQELAGGPSIAVVGRLMRERNEHDEST